MCGCFFFVVVFHHHQFISVAANKIHRLKQHGVESGLTVDAFVLGKDKNCCVTKTSMETLNAVLYPEWLATWHEQLPPPFNHLVALVLLQDVERADEYLVALVVVLLSLAVLQLRAFARPPPVPLKRLPKRPAVSVKFKPDDPTTINVIKQLGAKLPGVAATGTATNTTSTTTQPSLLRKFDRFLTTTKETRRDRGTSSSDVSDDVPFPQVGAATTPDVIVETVPMKDDYGDEYEVDNSDDENRQEEEEASPHSNPNPPKSGRLGSPSREERIESILSEIDTTSSFRESLTVSGKAFFNNSSNSSQFSSVISPNSEMETKNSPASPNKTQEESISVFFTIPFREKSVKSGGKLQMEPN